MKIFRKFGIGESQIIAKGCCVKGTVTIVQKSILYIVKKPVRLYVNEQNTLFSHWITFTYRVNGFSYTGKRWVSLHKRCPQKGELIDLYYDPDKPENYACAAFGPAVKPIGW